jgi:uncharacterized protein (DUF1697 family)
MNLGGRRIKNDALAGHFEEIGLEDVGVFRASGNVVFSAPREAAGRLTRRIEEGLAGALGYEVVVFLRTAAEVGAISAAEPFPAKLVDTSKGKLQVSILADRPSRADREAILSLGSDEDRLAFGERELFWLPSGGILDTDLDLSAVDAILGVSTRRTKGTIDLIAAKYFSG